MLKLEQIHTKPNQTIWDVALEIHGGIEGVWDLIDQNEAVDSINYNLSTAEELYVLKNKTYNDDVLKYYKNKGVHPASNYNVELSNNCPNPYILNGYIVEDYVECEANNCPNPYVLAGYVLDDYIECI